MYEPVHGSAPDIAGTGRANPIGAIRCVALLLDDLGHVEAAGRVDDAVAASIAEGMTTSDLGGALTTEEAGTWIADRVVRAVVAGN